MGKDKQLEHLMSQIGDFGPYQLRQYFFQVLAGWLAGIHMLSLSTVAPTPEHRCFIPEIDLFSNSSLTDLSNFIPVKSDGSFDSCHKYQGGSNNIINCEGQFYYDQSYYKDSKVIEWNMICDNRWQRAILQTIYMLGVLFAALILGPLSDKFGRKPIFCASAVLQLITGLGCAFITNLPLYSICLFFYGSFGSGGAYVSSFTLTMELVGPSKRTICGIGYSFVFAIGVMMVAMYASIIHDASMLQMVYALHALTLVGHWWLIDESIRWLWGQGRITDALKILDKAAKLNNVKLDLGVPATKEKQDDETNEGGEEDIGILALLKTSLLRRRTLIVTFNWFANSLVYYGLSLNSGNLVGNPFLMLFLLALVELPAYVVVTILIDKLGRRSVCTVLMILGGLACIIAAFIPQGNTVTAIVLIGKLCISGSFSVIYNYTAEIFPTVSRNSAIGLGTTAARLSGSLTPLITLLDTLDKRLPTIIFGCVSVASALISLFLPETLNAEMPQTIEDGENFKVGDNGFRSLYDCVSRRNREDRGSVVVLTSSQLRK